MDNIGGFFELYFYEICDNMSHNSPLEFFSNETHIAIVISEQCYA